MLRLVKFIFFTATIHQWKYLLNEKENKDLAISYLKELSQKKLIKVYVFVSFLAQVEN